MSYNNNYPNNPHARGNQPRMNNPNSGNSNNNNMNINNNPMQYQQQQQHQQQPLNNSLGQQKVMIKKPHYLIAFTILFSFAIYCNYNYYHYYN